MTSPSDVHVTTVTNDSDDTPQEQDDTAEFENLFGLLKLAEERKKAADIAFALVQQQYGTDEALTAQDMRDRMSTARTVEASNAQAYADEAEKIAYAKRSKLDDNYDNAGLFDHTDVEEAKMASDAARAKAIATANVAGKNQVGKTPSLFKRVESFFSPTKTNEVQDSPRTEMEKHAHDLHDTMMHPPIDEGITFGGEPLSTTFGDDPL